ncbi:FAD binding domain-containing protein [Xylariales sp. PMI_506]|nr:FAD binding domain-containing protein [Xylariales sp. PMI_506]
MLDVVIVGAGITGLATAITLRRAGHRVHIYERSALNNEVGAAITVPPNVSRYMGGSEGQGLGIDPVRWRFQEARGVVWQDPISLAILNRHSHENNVAKYGAPLYLAHRVDLHDALRHAAIASDGPGMPATIHSKARVVAYSPEIPSATLESGEVVRADLIVAADGYHSEAVKDVTDVKNPPVSPEHFNCCYRFLIPSSALGKDLDPRISYDSSAGIIRVFSDPGNSQRKVIWYNCRDNTVQNFVGFNNDKSMNNVSLAEDYHAKVDKSVVLEQFAGFHPSLLSIIDKATEVKRWPLLYSAPFTSWRKGKMVLAGDAAHPMLPLQAQGGAQGMEDAVALGMVMSGATANQIEERLDIYQNLRKSRASVIQIRSNEGVSLSQLAQYMDEKDIPKTPPEVIDWNFRCDIAAVAFEAMKRYDVDYRPPSGF